ncbi:MAG TPA: DinB family protein [Ktedonobacterales bacterium]|nr:DinB family protein [Ktedonobacterales bacterium]
MEDTSEVAGVYDLALSMLAATPASLAALLAPLTPEVWAWSPAPGEWSLRETLTHLLHVETAVIPVRVRQMIAQEGASLATPAAAAPAMAPEETLAAWQAARAQNLAFLRALTPTQLVHSGVHPRYGRISAREHIIEWAYHDLEHVRQLQATIEARLYPAIGGFRALYPSPYPVDERKD